jgi:uncharacterized protein
MHPIVFAVWLALAAPALAFTPQPGPPLKPSESVWQPAPTPKGGVSWALLESTKETTRLDSNNLIRTKPLFPPAVKALAGKRIKVSGYMLPLENSDRQSHFVLLAYPPDCPFHLNPNPMQFIEVRTRVPVPVSYDVKTIEGVLTLHGEDEQGVFYRFTQAVAL